MGTEAFFLLLLRFTILLGIIGHLVFVTILNSLFIPIAKSIKIASLCRVTQIESDTVRYQTWKAINKYEKSSKELKKLLIVVVVFIVVFSFIQLYLIHNDPLTLYAMMGAMIGVMFVLLVIDLVLLGKLTATIREENARYNERKNDVIAALKAIHSRYPMFQENRKGGTYPMAVSKLNEVIIKRRATREKEATLEDAKNSLAMIARGGDFEKIFGYLKLDSTLQDEVLLKKSYTFACNNMKSQNKFKYCVVDDRLPVALNRLGNYLPESGAVQQNYTPFYKRVQSVFAYSIFVLLVLLFPLFHMLYQSVGPPMIGAGTLVLVFGIILMSYT